MMENILKKNHFVFERKRCAFFPVNSAAGLDIWKIRAILKEKITKIKKSSES